MNRPEGRLEGPTSMAKAPNAPIALMCIHSAQNGGPMNKRSYTPYIISLPSAVLGASGSISAGWAGSQGKFDRRRWELRATPPRRWSGCRHTSHCLGLLDRGVFFGAWIGMPILMRRTGDSGFLSISHSREKNLDSVVLPPAPPRVVGSRATAKDGVPLNRGHKLEQKMSNQRDIKIEYKDPEGCHAISYGASSTRCSRTVDE